jgi:hypothetical protein
MLDNVAFWPFLEQPARKDAIPLVVALLLHRQLHESADLGRIFPRRGGLAGAQPDDRAPDSRAVAGAHFQIADQPVALVEQRHHRDPLCHWRRAIDAAALFGHGAGAGDFGFGLGHRLPAVGRPVTARQRRQQQRAPCRSPRGHPASGRQAS